MAQSELLTQFYRAYAAWLDDGAPANTIFGRDRGLCGNLNRWRHAVGMSQDLFSDLRDEMSRQFERRYPNTGYPFSSPKDYHEEARTLACHLNPQRIEWVRDHAQ